MTEDKSMLSALMKARSAGLEVGRMQMALRKAANQLKGFQEELEIEGNYKETSWVVLLRKSEEGWQSLGCFDTNNLPDDVPEEWSLCLPIPEPESVGEWQGW